MDLGAALMALLTAGIVKVFVLLYGARLLLRLGQAQGAEPSRRLWLLIPESDRAEMRWLRASLILFFLSELICGVEVYVLLRSNPIVSCAHAITSAAGMGLFALGLYRVLDRRLIRFGQPRCHLQAICRGCTLEQPEGCKFVGLWSLGALFIALASLLPFFASTDRIVADMGAYALPFESWNRWYDGVAIPWMVENVQGYDRSGEAYHLPEEELILELRVLPLVSLLLSIGAAISLRRAQLERGISLLLFSAGMLGFVYFELVIYRATEELIIGSLAHELGEAWFLLATFLLLRRLFPPPRERPGRAQPAPESSGR
ncbi:MAG: hypothetical protein OEY14_16505, partial [Myxococcales bacterium]|nr:hypothetical protein [Myxococcales bacterium]